jgi:MscS family membrane protein
LLDWPSKVRLLSAMNADMLPEWMYENLLHLKLWQWVGLFVLFLLAPIIKVIFKILSNLLLGILAKTNTDLDGKLAAASSAPVAYFGITVFWMLTIHLLALPETFHSILSKLIQTLLSISIIWLLLNLTEVISDLVFAILRKKNTMFEESMMRFFNRSLKVLVVVFGSLVALQNLGVNVMSLVAGLGLGGLAFALAAKDTAANLFGSIMIFLDKPFKLGDFIIVGDVEGSVEDIGFRSTRVRTFYDSLVSIPNATLVNENIENMGMRKMRRVRSILGVTYDTPRPKIEAFAAGIKDLILKHPLTDKELTQVYFNNFGPHSLDLIFSFFLAVDDIHAELGHREKIYLDVLDLAQSLGVSFAFPTQTIHIEQAK